MTNLFFSTLPNEYEKAFKDEIWGCYKYIGIPIETLYSMPIQDRKYFIQRHNADNKAEQERHNETTNTNERTFSGEMINSFAELEQKK